MSIAVVFRFMLPSRIAGKVAEAPCSNTGQLDFEGDVIELFSQADEWSGGSMEDNERWGPALSWM